MDEACDRPTRVLPKSPQALLTDHVPLSPSSPMTSQRELFESAAGFAQAGRLDEALKAYKSILRKEPGNNQARYRIAVVELMRGRFSEGAKLLRVCLRKQPDNSDILFSLGRACLPLGRHEEAVDHLAKAAEITPDRADILSALGDAYFLSGATENALQVYQAASALVPDDPRIKANMANAFSRAGAHAHAIATIETALALAPERPDIALAYANTLRAAGKLEAARSSIETLLTRDPGNIDAIAYKAELLDRMGENPAAAALLSRHLNTNPAPHALARAAGQVAINGNLDALPPDRVVALINTALSRPALNRFERRGLLFMQAALLQKSGKNAEAFDIYARANAESGVIYDQAAVNRRFDRYRNTFSLARLPKLSRSTVSDSTPIFIVGMPRSGTTLVEQIIDSHPDAAGGGELGGIPGATRALSNYPDSLEGLSTDDLNDIAHEYLASLRDISSEARFVTDKMPINAEHLGFIWQLFPNARVIHCRRHPLAIGLSCFSQNFRTGNEFAFSLEGFAHYYRHYSDLMQHWQETLNLPILDLRYETLVRQPRESIERLLEFCDLPWDDACLDFDKNQRFVDTLSYAQVRRPMTQEPAARHLKYETELAPLSDALAEEIAAYEKDI